MSFFSELGAGLRTVAKEYNDIKQEFVTIKDDVTHGIKTVADETAGITAGIKQTADETKAGIAGTAKTVADGAKNTIGGKNSIQ